MNIFQYASVSENEKPLDRIVSNGGFCAIFKSMAFIGDSLSSGEFESTKDNGEKGYHDYFEYSFGQQIARDAGLKAYNFSAGGMTAKAYLGHFAASKGYWDQDKACQAYVLALGVNDLVWQKQPVGSTADIDRENCENNKPTFAGYVAKIIQKYKAIQPKAKFFLVTMPKDTAWLEIAKAHRDLMYELAEFFDRTYVIDLYTYAPVYDDNFKEKYYLGGHMNAAGYVLTAKMLESYIDYIIRKNPRDFAQVGFIGTGICNATQED